MSDTFELTEEYIYRVAPDGKSCKSAIDLVKDKAFRQAKMSNQGRRLEAKCWGDTYTVAVDLTNPKQPGTSCDCMSHKQPCKHALGLMFLALRAPDEFEQDESSKRKNRDPEMVYGTARKEVVEKKQPPPKDTGEAILQSVLAEPEDDTPRLVYADWLEETGGPEEQARADFIRVQIELARLPKNDKGAKRLRAREKELWAAHKTAWLASLPETMRTRKAVAFQRGFYEELNLGTSMWASCADELFRAHPVFRLRPQGTLDRHKAGALVVVPHLTRIRVLKLTFDIEQPMTTLEILFNTPFFSNLTTLDVSGTDFGTRELGVLAASPLFPRLRVLELSDMHLGPKGVETLVESPRLEGLQRLILHQGTLLPGLYRKLEERFGDRLVRAE